MGPLLALVALLVVPTLGGCGGAQGGGPGGRGGGRGGKPSKEAGKVPVKATRAIVRTIGQSVEASAAIESRQILELHSDVAGQIREKNFDIGDRVEEGETLVVLEDPGLVRQLAEARLAQARREAEHERSQVRKTEIESEIASLELDLEELGPKESMQNQQLERDRENLADKERLWRRNLLSKSDYDAARTALEKAESDLRTTRYERSRKEIQLVELKTIEQERAEIEVKLAALEVEAEKVRVAQIQEDLAKMTIRAPAPGVVTGSTIQPGQWVTRESPLLTLAFLDPLIVRLRLPERDIGRLAVGQTVEVASPTLDELEVELSGKVADVSRLVDATSGTVEVRVTLDEHALLLPGMLVRCRIEVLRKEGAIVVPKRAILFEEGVPFVFKIVGVKAVRTEVELGFTRDDEVEVTAGLAAGDQVVTVGNRTLKDGTEIEVLGDGGERAAG